MHEVMLKFSTNTKDNHSFQDKNWNLWTDNGLE